MKKYLVLYVFLFSFFGFAQNDIKEIYLCWKCIKGYT